MKPRPYQTEGIEAVFDLWRQGHRRVLCVAATGMGKAQPVDEPVLTPSGWRPIGELQIGDEIVGGDGDITRISGVFPQGVQPCVKVSFSDGATTRCNPSHLWLIRDKHDFHRNRPWRVATTEHIASTFDRDWRIPLACANLPKQDLPLDPYLLGVLIGDGGLTVRGQVKIHTEHALARSLSWPDDCKMTFLSECGPNGIAGSYAIRGCGIGRPKSGCTPSVLDAVRTLGLEGKSSKTKFIPDCYMHSSVDDRLALLRGIMDTDGSFSNGHTEITVANERLAEQIADLVRSLGGTARVKRRKTYWVHKSEGQGGLAWRVSIALLQCPFLWKADRWSPRTKYGPIRQFASMQSVEPCEQVCISVDAFHKSYITRNYIVTHNTIAFAMIANRLPGRTMILAHTTELVDQAAHKVEMVTGSKPCIEMAERRAKEDFFRRSKIVVGSVQTMIAGGSGGRMQRFDWKNFDCLIFDEAHRSNANTYLRIAEYAESQNPDIKVLGFTATPMRTDGKPLALFEVTAFNYDILYGIDNGWLVPIRQRTVPAVSLDFSHVSTQMGDLNLKQTAEVMEQEGPLHEIATPTLEVAHGIERGLLARALKERPEHVPISEWVSGLFAGHRCRTTLVFTSSVRHAEMLSDIFNRARPETAAWVCGETPRHERQQILRDFASGKRPILCNVDVLVEGFDEPTIELISIGRPTKSKARYIQMIGRGTRALPGVVDGAEDRRAAIAASAKPSLEVIDFLGNAGRHTLISTCDILGDAALSPEVFARLKKRAESGPVDVREESVKIAREIEDEEKRKAEEKARRLAAMAKRSALIAGAQYDLIQVNPFSIAHTAHQSTGRHRNLPTVGMLRFLERHDIDGSNYSREQAGIIIGKIKRGEYAGPKKPTVAQREYLLARGIDSRGMTREQARAEMSRILQGGRIGGAA